MPELPEVETTRRGIAPHVTGQRVTDVVVRNKHLRWPIPKHLRDELVGQTIDSVERRAKYLLLKTPRGTAILHLGMSGSLRVVPRETPPGKFDHADIVLASGHALRLRDPRRFGALLWTRTDPHQHKLLKNIGPEPFDPSFNADYLFRASRRRARALRDFLLDSKTVAGVGNIYANEALFLAGIRPQRPAGRLTTSQAVKTVKAIRSVLNRAIQAGGTTLRDFQQATGEPGYFQFDLAVYGNPGKPCPVCKHPVKSLKLGQRSAFYCPSCQT
jgi:formamidopyrimidine-DNA glycosylase